MFPAPEAPPAAPAHYSCDSRATAPEADRSIARPGGQSWAPVNIGRGSRTAVHCCLMLSLRTPGAAQRPHPHPYEHFHPFHLTSSLGPSTGYLKTLKLKSPSKSAHYLPEHVRGVWPRNPACGEHPTHHGFNMALGSSGPDLTPLQKQGQNRDSH